MGSADDGDDVDRLGFRDFENGQDRQFGHLGAEQARDGRSDGWRRHHGHAASGHQQRLHRIPDRRDQSIGKRRLKGVKCLWSGPDGLRQQRFQFRIKGDEATRPQGVRVMAIMQQFGQGTLATTDMVTRCRW